VNTVRTARVRDADDPASADLPSAGAGEPPSRASTDAADRQRRRRGDALLTAIFDAVFEELATHGYEALSVERVAERARTGKASIYRRWPNKLELVVDALDSTLPSFEDPPDTGSVRGDLVAVFTEMARSMSDPSGCAVRSCILGQEPALADILRQRVLPPRKAMVVAILRRGAERGEVRPGAVSERVAAVGPMLLHGEVVQHGLPLPGGTVEAIVDEVILPLIRA